MQYFVKCSRTIS